MKFKQYKSDFDYSYAIGSYPALKLMENHQNNVLKVLVGKEYKKNAGAMKVVQMAEKAQIFVEVNDFMLQKFAQNDAAHIVVFFKKYEDTLDSAKNHVVLVNPSDMGNMGTIMRTMIGMNFSQLAIIKPAVDIFSPKVIRASMGEIFQLTTQYFSSYEEYSAKYSKETFMFMLNSQSTFLDQVKFPKSTYSLVFGSEGPGLASEFASLGTPIKIKQSDKIDSLNLSVSVGIGLYHFHQLE